MQEEVNIRRAPKLLPFGLTGSLLGAVLGVLVYFLVPDTDASPENALGLFLVYGAGTFGAIVLDWITVRKTKKVMAERSEQTPDNDKVGE